MTRLERWRSQPWFLEGVALSGLLLIIAITGLVGLGINAQMQQTTDRALTYDIELEDRGDDFRVAVLDLRHYHRNIAFVGPTRHGLADFESAYQQLHAQIDRLEELGIDDPNIYSPPELREIAERYYDEFRPAIELYNEDRQAFALASDDGLVRIAELEGAAREIDRLGEQQAAAALRRVNASGNVARFVLLTVLVGLVFTGLGLAYLIVAGTREKQRSSAALARALESKNAFIADASHELRTPLTVLRANAEVGLTLDRDCVHADLLQEIVRESERMTQLVEDLLFLARSDAHTVPLELELVDVEPFLAGLAGRAVMLAGKHGASLHSELGARGRLEIDRGRIEQVVLILVDNASKYSAAGMPVTLRSSASDGHLVVEVTDQGPGIPAEDLPQIFERFYRVDKARSRKKGGTGLGLSIAKSIVEGHGGRIEAHSTLNLGTTMRFYLPLVSS
jgi:signal transduction histidine kinase